MVLVELVKDQTQTLVVVELVDLVEATDLTDNIYTVVQVAVTAVVMVVHNLKEPQDHQVTVLSE